MQYNIQPANIQPRTLTFSRAAQQIDGSDQFACSKVPAYVAFAEALPLTATNKVQRAEDKTWTATLPGSLHCTDTRHLKR